ncbi:50S ribosomal protein L10 [Paraflavitalea speifideaquila]|uniref:50S ribosomal protein L10 n=1 Tax=Paraflavitalea speifideaquila TaxID=3076558 RepID=UPI0028E75309|nr:50S ribosomal protein L10 [Paraflavitalea speifideiaquila]
MTKQEKNEVIDVLKEKFSQYNNFYITNTESLTVAQIGKLRRVCFDKNVEMKVAKNTLIKKALESLDEKRYSGVFESLNGVTAIMFSENAKEPALIISDFRKDIKPSKVAKPPRPELKAAFIDGDVFAGDDQLQTLVALKSKNDLIGEIIGLLQSPAKNVISGLNAGGKLASLVKALEDRAQA